MSRLSTGITFSLPEEDFPFSTLHNFLHRDESEILHVYTRWNPNQKSEHKSFVRCFMLPPTFSIMFRRLNECFDSLCLCFGERRVFERKCSVLGEPEFCRLFFAFSRHFKREFPKNVMRNVNKTQRLFRKIDTFFSKTSKELGFVCNLPTRTATECRVQGLFETKTPSAPE